MSGEHKPDDIRAARRFAQRLAGLPDEFPRPALPPLLNVDPYLRAWTNVEAALGSAPAPERERRLRVAAELDRELTGISERFKFVYEPLETLIPVDSL